MPPFSSSIDAEFRRIAEEYGGRVAVAMSGGVDSSVAAARLVRQGVSIIGVTMKLWNCAELDGLPQRPGLCCSPKDVRDAQDVCKALNVPHFLLKMEEDFEREIIEPFARDYEGIFNFYRVVAVIIKNFCSLVGAAE